MNTGSLSGRLAETLGVFDDPCRPKTTTEVAESLDLGRRGTYKRLERLAEEGWLETKKVGANARVWWRPSPITATLDREGPGATGSLVEGVLDDVGIGIIVLDADFEIAWLNDTVGRYFDLEREAVLGSEKPPLVEERIAGRFENPEEFTERVLAAYDDNTGTERFECRLAADDGEATWLEHRSKPIESGPYAGGRVEFYVDVTERKRSELAHREARDEFKSLIDAVEEYAIFSLDPDGYVRTWNDGAERIKGYTADEIRGDHFSTFYTEADREAGVPEQNLARAASDGMVEDEGWRLRADGSRFWAHVTITPVRGEDGELEGYAKVTRDMTEQKRVETERELLYETTRAIAEADRFEEGLRTALEVVCERTEWEYAEAWMPTGDGTLRRAGADYYHDGHEAFATLSESVAFERGEGLPGRVWASGEFEWATDLSNGSVARYPRLEAALDAGLQSSLGVPIVADGEVVTVLTFLMRDPRETDRRMIEIVSSVAADLGALARRRQVEAEMERERELVDRILETSPVGIMVLDDEGTFTRINDRAREILGISTDEAGSYLPADREVYDTDGTRVPPEDQPAFRALSTGEPVFDWECRVEVPDGPDRWLIVNAEPILDADGEVTRVIVAGEDITRLKEQTRRLERRRDELEAELADVFDRISDGVFGLDCDLCFSFVNDRAAELLEIDASAAVGRHAGTELPVTDEFETALQRAFDEQERVAVEEYNAAMGAWFEYTVHPSETGLSVYFRDVTTRKEREQELERYETIVETIDDGIYVLDGDGRFEMVNSGFVSMTGYSREELAGAHAELVFGDEFVEIADEKQAELESGTDSVAVLEELVYPATGAPIEVESRFSLLETDGGEMGRVGVIRDITERKRRERELEESERLYRTLVDNFPNGAVALVDEDLRYLAFGGTPVGDTDLTWGDLEGERVPEVLPSTAADVFVPAYEAALDGETTSFVREMDDRVYQFHFTPVRDAADDVFGAIGMAHDITEEKERERKLEARIRQQEVLTELSQRALESHDLDDLFRETTERLVETMDSSYCKILELDAEAEELLLRHGVGWDEGLVGTATVSAVDDDSQAAYTLASSEPVVVEDLDTEMRFSGPDLLTDHDVRSGMSAIIGPRNDPWGILGIHDVTPRTFSNHDAPFIQAVANTLSYAINRHAAEQQLIHQREQLSVLNNVNEVVQEVTSAVIERSTREEIQEAVCDCLAASDSYLFAWIGEVDTETEHVTLQAEAGVDGYLDDITISVDPSDERSTGPTGHALNTGEVQTVQRVGSAPDHDPWRDTVDRYEFRASAAIPLVHEGTVYGVLNVYTERPDAFDEQERTVVAQLGEIVGHAIAAAERKQALVSDELVELGIRIQDFFEPTEARGRIEIDHTVSTGDETFLVYGTATEEAVETVESLVDERPEWEAVKFYSGDEPGSFELTVHGSPLLSTVESLGGYIDRAVIEDGDLQMTVHLAPTVEVREAVDRIKTCYPQAEMLRRRQISRSEDGSPRTPLSELTDRQRTTLEAAYHAGFFEWPRDASGEDVAQSMGVSPPTFHQHLRKAERKVLESLLSTPGESVG